MIEQDPSLDRMPTDIDFTDDANPKVGKYAAKLSGKVRLVQLDADVADRFPDADSVNAALRTLMTPDAPNTEG
jgi:hypothetical protein